MRKDGNGRKILFFYANFKIYDADTILAKKDIINHRRHVIFMVIYRLTAKLDVLMTNE